VARSAGTGHVGRCRACCCKSMAANIAGFAMIAIFDLLVLLDDATSDMYNAQRVEEESTRTMMCALGEVIEMERLFCALYSDRGSHFLVTRKAGEKVDPHQLTQVGRTMKELGVGMVPAYSPQAPSGYQRSFGTWQNRSPQELRPAGISTLEYAVADPEFIWNALADKTADKDSKARIARACNLLIVNWSHPPGSNRRPADYESAALPTELGWLELLSV
jgi:hypothetical protein